MACKESVCGVCAKRTWYKLHGDSTRMWAFLFHCQDILHYAVSNTCIKCVLKFYSEIQFYTHTHTHTHTHHKCTVECSWKCMHYHLILSTARGVDAIISERCLLPFSGLSSSHQPEAGTWLSSRINLPVLEHHVSGLYSTHSHLLLSVIKSSWENKMSDQRLLKFPIKRGTIFILNLCTISYTFKHPQMVYKA